MLDIRIFIEIAIASSVNTIQNRAVLTFNSPVRNIIVDSKSDGITCQRSKWIGTKVIFLKPYSMNIFSGFSLFLCKLFFLRRRCICLKLLLNIHGNCFLDDLILTRFCLLAGEQISDLSLICAKNIYHRLYRRLQILRLCIGQLTIQNNVVNFVASRQNRSIAVVNIPSLGRQSLTGILLL